MKDFEYRFIPADAYTDADRDAITGLWLSVWPDHNREYYTENMARTAEISGDLPTGYPGFWKGDRIAAVALVFPREIQTPRGSFTVMALSGVCVNPDLRGQGLGAGVVKKAFSFVGQGTYPVNLFQTSFRVAPFYKDLGCRRVNNSFINSLPPEKTDPETLRHSVFWDEVAMIYPADFDWPAGQIDLRGPGY
ncbi:GNAT family N-acetyltransferase [Marispirochaeta sp.]|jgi:GNAT superfamily N-acetyltransferase|uniref:GNAT family N-acetyltransferase n=1 Tax=Marispirochaeta sp. TaxID=2038653 RepID=UPI0029C60F81|nr:GNAT family N-acetyltransferase [Marispirochaeta sp.]